MRLLAVFLSVTAVLYVCCEALDPRGTGQVITTTATAFRVLPIAAAIGHRQANPPHHPRRSGRLRARHLPAHSPADRNRVVLRGPRLRRPVLYFYFPRCGIIIALAANSSTDNDDLQATAISVYQTLQKAGAVRTS